MCSTYPGRLVNSKTVETQMMQSSGVSPVSPKAKWEQYCNRLASRNKMIDKKTSDDFWKHILC